MIVSPSPMLESIGSFDTANSTCNSFSRKKKPSKYPIIFCENYKFLKMVRKLASNKTMGGGGSKNI